MNDWHRNAMGYPEGGSLTAQVEADLAGMVRWAEGVVVEFWNEPGHENAARAVLGIGSGAMSGIGAVAAGNSAGVLATISLTGGILTFGAGIALLVVATGEITSSRHSKDAADAIDLGSSPLGLVAYSTGSILDGETKARRWFERARDLEDVFGLLDAVTGRNVFGFAKALDDLNERHSARESRDRLGSTQDVRREPTRKEEDWSTGDE